MIDIRMREKADIPEKAGFRDAARHLRRWARKLDIPMPPREAPTVDLPALAGISADDLSALAVAWRRTRDGAVISVPAPRGVRT